MTLVYDQQGNYTKALEYYQKALTIREKVWGKEHLDTAKTYIGIAVVYHGQGDYAKALEYYQKAVVILEKALGKEHPNTALIYNNIAICRGGIHLGGSAPNTATAYSIARARVYKKLGELSGWFARLFKGKK